MRETRAGGNHQYHEDQKDGRGAPERAPTGAAGSEAWGTDSVSVLIDAIAELGRVVTEPGADRGPRPGSPAGVVDATGSPIQLRPINFAGRKTSRRRLNVGSRRYRSRFCNDFFVVTDSTGCAGNDSSGRLTIFTRLPCALYSTSSMML